MKKLLNIYNINIDSRKPFYLLFISFFVYLFIVNFLNVYLKQLIPINPVIENTKEVFLSLKKVLVLLIFASFLEEIKYRFLFTKFNLNYLLISLAVILSDIIFLIFRTKTFSLFKQDFYTIFSYYGGIMLLTFLIFKISKPIIYSFKEKIESFYNDNFIKLIYLQLVAFPLWHIFFTNQTNGSHFIIVFVIQFLAALYFTIIRINYGIIYSVFFHFCSNLIAFLPLFIF